MESKIHLQCDLQKRIEKSFLNFKKSSKERLTKDYIESRLESLESMWAQYMSNHSNIVSSSDVKLLQSTKYITDDLFYVTEECYVEYKCVLKSKLSAFSTNVTQTSQNANCSNHNNVKLPKITIPQFSGDYSQWSTFRDLFVSLVHKSDIDKAQKMQYLKGLLSGEAEQLVRHINISSDNYDRCWSMLEERYNNKRFLTYSVLKRLFNQKIISSESPALLKEMIDTTTECLGSLTNLGVDVSTWDVIVIYMLTLKMDSESRKQWELQIASTSSQDLPTMTQFKEFITSRYRALEFLDSGAKFNNRSYTHKPKTFHVANVVCKFCSDNHRLANCKQFANARVQARRVFVEKNRICFNCLGDKHSAKFCLSKISCRVCNRKHHSLLHPNGSGDAGSSLGGAGTGSSTSEVGAISTVEGGATSSAPVVCFSSGGMEARSQVLLATALVRAENNQGEQYTIRALLDQGAQASFITEATAQYLGLKKSPVKGYISGLEGNQSVSAKGRTTLTFSSIYDAKVKLSVDVYILKTITTLLPSKRIVTAEWVCDLPLADPQYNTPNKIDILLGAEVYSKVIQDGVRKGPQNNLVAQNTSLGWILSGRVTALHQPTANVVVMHSCVEDNDMLKKFWEMEAEPQLNKCDILTDEEKRCEEFFSQTTTRDMNGRYVVRLPFKNEEPDLKIKNSKKIAGNRLNFVINKLEKNSDMRAKYSQVMEEYLSLGHLEKVPEEEVNNSKAVYLPHFAVVRFDKDTTQVRVVFDASCKGEDGISLNDLLMVGPRLQPELRHLLMKWRLYRICLSADIIKMYRQIKVAQQDIDFQRILWKENAESTVTDYRLLRVTFGTASAPYLAVKALQQVAIDEGAKYPMTARRVMQDFYMDDLLTGCDTVEQGITIYNEMNELLQKGGFKLQKWSSNSKQLLDRIQENRDRIGMNEELKLKVDDIMKLLGLTWNRMMDTFQYTVLLPQGQEPVTKRIILSDVARLFDPLGWVAPTVILAKMMIQKLWLSGVAWDEAVPSNILNEWLTYRRELTQLSTLQIPRWLNTSANNVLVELHGFSDASKLAYAAAVYIRVVGENGDVHVSLVTAKTKVAPIKQISIPRLELCGAVLVTKLLIEVAETLNISKRCIQAWTDSTVVLAWLNSHPSRWQTFIANRVSEILMTLEAHQWSHVQSKSNPADCASRGLKPSELMGNKLWFEGPEFLHERDIKYNKVKDLDTDLEEIKVNLVASNEDIIWDKYSNLTKLIRVVAYVRRVLSWRKNMSRRKGFLRAEELREAMNVCVRKCQRENFAEEINFLMINKLGKLKGQMKSLNPFIDGNDNLRVGGRLEKASLSEGQKHPLLLPKKSNLTDLVITDAHSKTLHGGPQLMLAYLRSRYCILGAKDLVKRHVRTCVKCVRFSAKTTTPLMGQLPSPRVTPSRPFSNSGVDFAGPINVRISKGRGQHAYKGYICLFVCMATKAIHIEVVSDLTTQGFLAAFKRFVSRRGYCSNLWSDNGTNFVGASRELDKLFYVEKSGLHKDLAETLATNGTTWHFIPPHSPNFGGLWEAGVKSVKFHLRRIIGDTTLTYEELATVLTQIEACLNSRPLSRIESDSDGFEVLTPGHFLVGEPLLTVPEQNYESQNITSLRRWQLTQRMMQNFWRRWSQEYLTTFLHRYKWASQSPEPNIGDLVLVKEEDLPPSRWLLGRIIAKHPGSDGITRVVSLRTKASVIKRPTSKICILPISNV
ncbi:hypothetical protein K1T71_014738 [Dendrolimus kikuchii]|nr:hypothetical protein K1T71_014738 [Dendrolimus kikuchii]